MNVVMIIPTGIGCEFGGYAGDANPIANLLASVCDTLLLHPNVVNASDINEMPKNSLYVDGYMLDQLLSGKNGLKRVKSNRILVAVNRPLQDETFNAVSASRITLGADISIVELNTPLEMKAFLQDDGMIAGGRYTGISELAKQVYSYDFDALAIATLIETEDGVADNYFKNGGVNPWGGIEAIVSRRVSAILKKPVAHSPYMPLDELLQYNMRVDPRMAPEMISTCFLHSVLKGLYKAPQFGDEITVDDIDCLITPPGCMGTPHYACLENNIPIICVKENKNVYEWNSYPDPVIVVESYLEAAGVISAMKEGISLESLRRPFPETKVY